MGLVQHRKTEKTPTQAQVVHYNEGNSINQASAFFRMKSHNLGWLIISKVWDIQNYFYSWRFGGMSDEIFIKTEEKSWATHFHENKYTEKVQREPIIINYMIGG